MKKLKFTKMHGLGNDFIILENIDPLHTDLSQLAIQLCNRRLGIGADGIVLVLPSENADFLMRIINSDGSEANMCGNAIRCFAKYVYEHKMINDTEFAIETFAGIMLPHLIESDGKVIAIQVDMGNPSFKPQDIPMKIEKDKIIGVPLVIDDNKYLITSMLMGVPHTIVFVDNVNSVDIEYIGPKIEKHEWFPKGTNVNFVEIINTNQIKVRTWERGAGATLACGTGCCASVVASSLNNKTNKRVKVNLAVGDLDIDWTDENKVLMTGPAEYVFKGETGI